MKLINYKQSTTMIRSLIFASLMLLAISATLTAQETQRIEPKFWIGVSGAANVNMYTGTTQTLNSSLMVPSAFHDGFGIKGFGSLLLEYRPVQVIGLMLNLGYDNRGGAFDQVLSPCDCPADLITNLSYATIQPSLRISPFGRDFYVFLGGAYGYNINKAFAYTIDQNTESVEPTTEGDFSNVRRDVYSTHVGMGYDIQLASANNTNQVALSPFVSYHPYFGQAPRDIESWSLSTVRVGMALKFGKGKAPVGEVTERVLIPKPETPKVVVVAPEPVKVIVKEPYVVPAERSINESFPLRNYIFFEEGSSKIPNRYVKLNSAQALNFKPEHLRKQEPKDNTGRSARQMHVYYNILNVLGYRMIENPSTSITLIGSSAGDGELKGKEYAESVKQYLVTIFGISPTRITSVGRNQPLNPSQTAGGTTYVEMLSEGDRRVDIVGNPPGLLSPLQIIVAKENQIAETLRFSILFDFDKSNAVDHYKAFLLKEVAPLIKSNGTVIIHGHTDIIGNSAYNLQLSERRANDIRQILENAVIAAGKTGVRFDMYAYGMDTDKAPFDNIKPEERFYNRTVIIDILQQK